MKIQDTDKPIRCFIAIELSLDAKQRLAAIIQNLKTELKYGFRWADINNIHLTLKFLGDTARSTFPELLHGITSSIESFSQFNISIQKLGAFPNLRQPRILWAGVEAPPDLFRLQAALDDSTKKIGLSGEVRPYSPHLSLARSQNNISTPDISILSALLTHSPTPFEILVPVHEVVLFQSDLKPQGPAYTPLTRASLRK